jgi:RNA polymerase sigma-70 factor (sigma-E family)
MTGSENTSRGRDEEFREFMRDRASPLQQSAYLLCGDWHLAQDVTQETLLKAYLHWPRVRRADSPDAYVRRILLNEVRGRWRRRKGMEPAARFTDMTEPTVPDATEEIARRAGLLQALLTLPLRQRATVVLRYLEGMTERETAAALGCGEGTVKSQSARALSTLRTFLDRTESRL